MGTFQRVYKCKFVVYFGVFILDRVFLFDNLCPKGVPFFSRFRSIHFMFVASGFWPVFVVVASHWLMRKGLAWQLIWPTSQFPDADAYCMEGSNLSFLPLPGPAVGQRYAMKFKIDTVFCLLWWPFLKEFKLRELLWLGSLTVQLEMSVLCGLLLLKPFVNLRRAGEGFKNRSSTQERAQFSLSLSSPFFLALQVSELRIVVEWLALLSTVRHESRQV